MTNNTDQVKQSFLQELNRLIESAKKLNLVVEIKLQPNQPLAMGNFEMVGDVREARYSRSQFLSEEQVDEIDNAFKSLKRDGVIMPWIGKTYLLCEKHGSGIGPIGVISEDLYLKKINPPKVEGAEDVSFIDKPTSP
jgi:hypothetical protein